MLEAARPMLQAPSAPRHVIHAIVTNLVSERREDKVAWERREDRSEGEEKGRDEKRV